MIKIIKATYINDFTVKLEFSDSRFTNHDFSYLLLKNSELTISLNNKEYFKSFFLELGAICWKNGLELSAGSLYEKAKASEELFKNENVA